MGKAFFCQWRNTRLTLFWKKFNVSAQLHLASLTRASALKAVVCTMGKGISVRHLARFVEGKNCFRTVICFLDSLSLAGQWWVSAYTHDLKIEPTHIAHNYALTACKNTLYMKDVSLGEFSEDDFHILTFCLDTKTQHTTHRRRCNLNIEKRCQQLISWSAEDDYEKGILIGLEYCVLSEVRLVILQLLL